MFTTFTLWLITCNRNSSANPHIFDRRFFLVPQLNMAPVMRRRELCVIWIIAGLLCTSTIVVEFFWTASSRAGFMGGGRRLQPVVLLKFLFIIHATWKTGSLPTFQCPNYHLDGTMRNDKYFYSSIQDWGTILTFATYTTSFSCITAQPSLRFKVVSLTCVRCFADCFSFELFSFAMYRWGWMAGGHQGDLHLHVASAPCRWDKNEPHQYV